LYISNSHNIKPSVSTQASHQVTIGSIATPAMEENFSQPMQRARAAVRALHRLETLTRTSSARRSRPSDAGARRHHLWTLRRAERCQRSVPAHGIQVRRPTGTRRAYAPGVSHTARPYAIENTCWRACGLQTPANLSSGIQRSTCLIGDIQLAAMPVRLKARHCMACTHSLGSTALPVRVCPTTTLRLQAGLRQAT